MKINSIGYLIKEGIKSIFSHGFMSLAAVLVTVACLLIVGSISAVTFNVSAIVKELNETNEIIVLIDENYTVAEAKQVQTKVSLLDNIHKTAFKTREQALEEFIADHDNDPAFAGASAEDLRHRVIVTLLDNSTMEFTVSQIRMIEGVADITAPYELAEGFSTLQRVMEIVSAVLLILLCSVSMVIISNTVKLAMMDRKEEIGIMKMVGATNGFIRLPFVVQSFLLGLIGAGVAFVLMWVSYDLLVGMIEDMDTLQMFQFVPFDQLLLPMGATFGLAGLLVGILGSWTSIQKFMDV